MALRVRKTLYLGLVLAALMLVAGPAAGALASAQIRLVNARGGSAVSLQVSVGGKKVTAGSAVSYGQAGALAAVPAGQAKILVGGQDVTKQLANGRSYTVVALPSKAVEVLTN